MTLKPINTLPAKTPAATDVMAVADPFNGQTGKVTVEQIANNNTLYAPVITTNGNKYYHSASFLVPPSPAYYNGVVYGNGGKWINSQLSLSYDSGVTSITYSDVRGFDGSISSIPSGVTSISFPELEVITGQYSILGYNPLSTFSTPKLKYVGGDYGPYNLAITSVNLPTLVAVGGGFKISNNASLTSISVPVLEATAAEFSVNGNSSLASFNASSLKTVGRFVEVSNGTLTSISFPALIRTGSYILTVGMASLTSYSIPVIERIGTTISSGNAIAFTSGTGALTTFSLPTTLKQVGSTGGNVVFTSCALTQASVDNILVRLAALDGTNGTTAFSNRVVTITGTSAAPSATGLSAKSTLVARGCTVTHN